MCIRIGEDELDTVKGLMSMGLNAVISDTLAVELDELTPEMTLRHDLQMDAEKEQALREGIADCFDGLEVDLSTINTIGELFNRVIQEEFDASLETS